MATVKTPKKLATFILVDKDRTLSPVLTTIREYGRWLQENFDEYTCNYELFMKSVVDGKSSLTYHPGTKIGKFFDVNKFNKDVLKSWFVYQDSTVFTKLILQKLAEMRDCVPISVNDPEHRRMLRLYSIDQIELYIRNNLDKTFTIGDKILTPKQVKIGRTDMSKLIIPTPTKRKSLLGNVGQKHTEITIHNNKKEIQKHTEIPKEMTLSQIEEVLGYKINLIQEEAK